MPELVAVLTTPPNENPYQIYVGGGDKTIQEMEHLGELPFGSFDADTVLKLEDFLAGYGYLVDEWVEENLEYRCASLVEIEA